MARTAKATREVVPRVSSLPPECWSAVGEQIRSPQTLRALIETCHAFQDIFTPFLYRFWRLELSKYLPGELVICPPPPSIRHTRDFEVLIAEFCTLTFRLAKKNYSVGMNLSYATTITKLLKEMTAIRSFTWRDNSMSNEYGPSLILRHPDLLNFLKGCQNLKHISILFATQWLEDRLAATNCSIPLKGFRNLTSLELYHFYGDEAEILNDLVSTLGDSPNLQTLGLALACDCDCDRLPEAVIVEDELDFFENLCVEYGSRVSRSPLPLKTLKLGHGMYILKTEATTDTSFENYLAKLVKISNLRVLRIFNGLFKFEDNIDDEPESMEIAWSLFKECTLLRQLSVTRLEDDVRDWLNTVGRSVQELIVTDHYETYEHGWENFNALNLPCLKMLFTREEGRSRSDSEDEWSDVDSMESPVDSDFLRESPGNSHSDTELLPTVDRSTRTVLDRLHDGGTKLESLCLDLDFETQWEQFSSHLPKMHSLKQLRIGPRTWRHKDQYPTEESSLWRTVKKPKGIACRYAKLIQTMCPSLQYIRVGQWTWEFIYRRRGAPILRELEFEEIMSLEIMSFETFPHEAGLPSTELPEDYED